MNALTAEELDGLEALRMEANANPSKWDAWIESLRLVAPRLIASARREQKMREALTELLAVLDIDYNDLSPDDFVAFNTRYDAAENAAHEALK